MRREDLQKVYTPQGDMLELRIKRTLASLEEKPERSMSMKKVFVIALAAVLALVSLTALAAGLMVSSRVDARQLADRALEETYGITGAMHTYFSQNAQQMEDGSVVVTYAGFEDFAYVLGTYTVTVKDGKAQAVWSRDGESTEGGFDACAWGAQQLAMVLDINRETHSFGEAAMKAAEHAQAADAAAWEAPQPQDAPEGYQSWSHYYRAQALPVMAIAPKDALALAKDAIVQRYGLTQAQADKMEWHDTWTDFSMVNGIPVLDVWFWLTLNEDGAWSEGDGVYGASVNVENGVIEEMVYDSALAGNG